MSNPAMHMVDQKTYVEILNDRLGPLPRSLVFISITHGQRQMNALIYSAPHRTAYSDNSTVRDIQTQQSKH